MNALFRFQDVLMEFKNFLQNHSLVQELFIKMQRRKIANPFFIHQSVEAGNFDRIFNATCSKDA